MTGDIKFTIEEGTLVLRIPLSQDHGLSGSGKSTIVASSGGFVSVPGEDVQFGLNVIRPKKKA